MVTRGNVLPGALATVTIFLGAIQIGRELKRLRALNTRSTKPCSVEQQVADRTEALSRAITEVKRSEQQFRLITELSPVHLFRATPDGEAIFLSSSFLVMTGLTQNQARGFGWIDAVHPDDRDRLMAGWHDALNSQAIFQAEFRFRARPVTFAGSGRALRPSATRRPAA